MSRRPKLIWVHYELDDLGLDPYEFRIYARIARRAGTGKGAYESAAKMAEGCMMSTRQVHRALSELVAMGLVKKEARPGQPSVYRLTETDQWNPDASASQADANGGTSASQARVTSASQADEVVQDTSDNQESNDSWAPPSANARGKNKERARAEKQGEGVTSYAEPLFDPPAPPKGKPARKPSGPHGLAMAAIEAWNSEPRPTLWAKAAQPTSRLRGDMKKFLANFDSFEDARTAVVRAIAWARHEEDWWRRLERATIIDEMAGKDKLYGYWLKASERDQRAASRRRGGGQEAEQATPGGTGAAKGSLGRYDGLIVKLNTGEYARLEYLYGHTYRADPRVPENEAIWADSPGSRETEPFEVSEWMIEGA